MGSICIDGINIAAVPLERLRYAFCVLLMGGRSINSLITYPRFRSSLAVIPQDPFLFSGTLRENLDPCSKVSVCGRKKLLVVAVCFFICILLRY